MARTVAGFQKIQWCTKLREKHGVSSQAVMSLIQRRRGRREGGGKVMNEEIEKLRRKQNTQQNKQKKQGEE